MNVWQSLTGMVEAELTGADDLNSLKRAAQQGIVLYDVKVKDELTVSFLVSRQQYDGMELLCRKRGDRLRILRRRGAFWRLRQMLRRPVLVAGTVLLFLASVLVPSRVLFLEVEGNRRVETARILEAAEQNGLCFGASRREIRSERIKNALLHAIPELQWAGVNTAGCRAVISVREGAAPVAPETPRPGSIVAAADGVIVSCTAQQGNLLCRPGQAVSKGEVLISGYTDCGLCIRLEEAKGEVWARTSRRLDVIAPMEYRVRGAVQRKKRNYSLLFGKKRINFWNSSGIWDAGCGRIYKEQYLTLPGGLRLPLGLAWDEVTETAQSLQLCSQEDLLRRCSEAYLLKHTAAGEILSKQEFFTQDNGLCCLTAQYSCREMIGRLRPEQIGEYHGQTD